MLFLQGSNGCRRGDIHQANVCVFNNARRRWARSVNRRVENASAHVDQQSTRASTKAGNELFAAFTAGMQIGCLRSGGLRRFIHPPAAGNKKGHEADRSRPGTGVRLFGQQVRASDLVGAGARFPTAGISWRICVFIM